jgi:hypothetical protein
VSEVGPRRQSRGTNGGSKIAVPAPAKELWFLGTHRRKTLWIREAAAVVCSLWKGSSVALETRRNKPRRARALRQEASVFRLTGLRAVEQTGRGSESRSTSDRGGPHGQGWRWIQLMPAAPTAASLEVGDALAAIQHLSRRCRYEARTSVRAEGGARDAGPTGASREIENRSSYWVLMTTSRLQRFG